MWEGGEISDTEKAIERHTGKTDHVKMEAEIGEQL